MLLLVICIANFNGSGNALNVLGIIVGTYFLIDCSQGWLTLMALWIFFDEKTINAIVGLNVGALLVHLTLLLFGSSLNNLTNGNKGNLIVILGIVLGVGLCFGFATHSDKGWVQNKCHPIVPEVVDNRSFDQIQKDADDAYRAERIREGNSPENEFARNRGEN